ncbi:MAG TPA: protein kinase [Polyangiaceae bacterium]
MPELALARYEIRSVLGRGGNGVVYEAFDSQDRALVALKTIAHPLADDLFRLKQEFRALADIHHPNLVRYGELACERGQWFFTMELVRGRDFRDYVCPRSPGSDARPASHVQPARRGAPDATNAPEAANAAANPGEADSTPFDEARLRAALSQLASALLAVHASGRVHRDVKPSNVLVTPDGRVVLLDFGLVTALSHTSHADEMLGTPAYMAPEQAEGRQVGPEADWYSVGVMLFAALTGSLPFDGYPSDVVAQKLTKDAPAPRARKPDVPADLDALCTELLRRAPEGRPRGEEIAARLGLPLSEQFPSAVRSLDTSSAPFVGRADELRALVDELEGVRAGSRGRTVIVEGEPGIGKSSLVQRFLGRLPSEVLVLTGRCYEQESVPFKGLDGVIDALSEHLVDLPDLEARALFEGGVRYLSTVFPVMHRVPVVASTVSAREVADPAALREQAFGELERLLGALVEDRTLVVFVDDLQWADQDSLLLLDRLLRADAPRFLFVATVRTGGSAAWEGLAWIRAAHRVRLRALSPTEARAFLDAASPPQATTTQRKEALIREAQGHPLFLAELARRNLAGAGEAQPQAHLEDVLWAHVAERDEIDRRLLETVAVAGVPIPYDVVAKAASVDPGECQTRLAPLRAAQLLRVGRRGKDRVIEAYHDRVREAILARLTSAGAVPEKHLRLGRALLEATAADALPARVFGIVRHLNAAQDLLADGAERRQAAELNLLASRQAQLATAYAGARTYALAGLALLGDSAWSDAYPVARDLLLARLVAESFGGNPEGAKECFDEARARLTSPADRTALYTTWVALRTSRGELTQAIEAGRERLRELGTSVAAKPSALAVLAQYVTCQLRQGRRSTSDLLHLPKLVDPVREGVIELVVALAPAAFFVDTNLLAWLELEGVATSLRHGVSEVSSYAFAVYGTVLTAVFSKHEEGEAFGRLALALNERFQNRKLAARIHFLYGGWHSSWVRPFKDGIEYLKTSHELATKHGDTAYETYSASTRSLVEFSQAADLSTLRATSEWAIEVGARRQDADMTGFAEVFARYCAALQDDAVPRRDLARGKSTDADFRATLTDAKTPSSVYYYFYCDAELAYLAGDPARAQPLLDEAWKRTQIVFGLPTFVDLTFLDALVAARLHDTASWTERGALRRRVAKRVGKLKGWAKSCAANFEPYHLIAAAELARVRGEAAQASTLFERAVTAARAHHAPKREIFALELGAAHAEATGDKARAETLRGEAADANRRWGTSSPALIRSSEGDHAKAD